MKDARFLSILLALTTVVGAVLGADYLYQHEQAPRPAFEPPAAYAPPALATQGVANSSTLPTQLTRDNAAGILRKCVSHDGKVSYTDKPCGAASQARELALTDSSGGLHPQRSYQQQLAEAQATPPAPAAITAGPVVGRIPISATARPECKLDDEEIAAHDATLRQLHDAASGDRLTAQRRQATDRRHALGCGR
jgi:hypothetical protein